MFECRLQSYAEPCRKLEPMDADYASAGAAAYIVRKLLMDASGMTPRGFEEFVTALEVEADKD